jgi:hypothetical protein
MGSSTIHTNLVSAIRDRLINTYVRATTGDVATLSAAGAIFTRSSGSFISDGIVIGDEVFVAGFATAGNNGRANVKDMTSTTLTVDKALTTEAAGGTRSIKVVLPQGRAWEGEDYSPIIGQPYIADAYNVLDSYPVGVGTGGVEAHDMQAIFAIAYPETSTRRALALMAGGIRQLFRPGVALYYGGDSGILMQASVSGRIITEPHWMTATVTALITARTTG